jgi:hypothetical protein
MLRQLHPERPAIEEGATSTHDLAIDRTRHHVARRKLGVLVDRAHEAVAAGIDEQCAFAAQRFSRERCGVASDIDGGGMELHEFGIGDHSSGPSGNGDAFAARLARVGGDGVDLAGASGCKHNSGCGQDELPRSSVHVGKLDGLDAPIAKYQIARRIALKYGNRGRLPHRGEQRMHDGAARGIALDVKDPVFAVRRLAAKAEMAF